MTKKKFVTVVIVTVVILTVVIGTVVIGTVVIVTVVIVTVVIFVTVVIVTVATVAAGTVVIVTYFSKNNWTPQQMRYSQGRFSRFSRCFFLLLLIFDETSIMNKVVAEM